MQKWLCYVSRFYCFHVSLIYSCLSIPQTWNMIYYSDIVVMYEMFAISDVEIDFLKTAGTTLRNCSSKLASCPFRLFIPIPPNGCANVGLKREFMWCMWSFSSDNGLLYYKCKTIVIRTDKIFLYREMRKRKRTMFRF